MLHVNFESILKPIDEQYREKMKKIKIKRKGNPAYTEKINTHVPGGWCVHSTSACRDVFDPVRIYPCKKELVAAKKCHICFKEFAHDEPRGD